MASRCRHHTPPQARKHAATSLYAQRALESATPLRQLIITYDYGIRSAQKADREGIHKTVEILQGGLDFFAAPEIAIGLLRLYLYCDEAAEHGYFEEVKRILTGLRDAWLEQAPMTPQADR